MQKINVRFSRLAIFIIYFWFGLLKVMGESPASPMVKGLFNETIGKFFHTLTPEQFVIFFGAFEVFVGILFLFPKLEKLALILLGLHIITTVMPLFVMGKLVWTKALVPTLEGQYIIKNIAIIALAINIWAHKRY